MSATTLHYKMAELYVGADEHETLRSNIRRTIALWSFGVGIQSSQWVDFFLPDCRLTALDQKTLVEAALRSLHIPEPKYTLFVDQVTLGTVGALAVLNLRLQQHDFSPDTSRRLKMLVGVEAESLAADGDPEYQQLMRLDYHIRTVGPELFEKVWLMERWLLSGHI
jgi:hypothetical protein